MDSVQGKNYIQELWATKPKVATVIIRSKLPELYATIDALSGKTFSEKAWCWAHDADPGVCQACSKPVKFLDYARGYATFCSTKCLANHTSIIEQRKTTNLLKYGVDHYSKTNEYKYRFKDTCWKKYGVENPGQIESLKSSRARNKQKTFFNSVIGQIDGKVQALFQFDEYTHLRDHRLEWKCLVCDTSFFSNLLDKLPECPDCYPRGNYGGPSSIENEVYEQVKQFYTGSIVRNSRKVIPPKELDLFFPDKNFAIEINGVYWHSDQQIDSDYHYKKYKSCADAGIRVLMITDHEWVHKKELILQMIKHRLGLVTDKIYARKCKITQLSSQNANSFLTKNHMHGFARASMHLGLEFNGILVSVVSLSRTHRFTNKNVIEIVRFANTNALVIGSFGKLLKEIKIRFPDHNISTYADLRYGDGNVYNKTGFRQTHITKPGYWYFINGRIDHRLNWTKQRLVKQGYPKHKTEREIMDELKALRIYDCGHKHYEWIHNE